MPLRGTLGCMKVFGIGIGIALAIRTTESIAIATAIPMPTSHAFCPIFSAVLRRPGNGLIPCLLAW